MEFDQLTLARRSVRKYMPGTELNNVDLETILKTTLLAPSWKNSETGRYYVATSPEAIEAVRACLPAFNQKSSTNACALVVTTFVKNLSGFADGTPVNELGNGWGAYDLGLQNAYFLLKAKELGYDSLIMGIRDADGLRNACGIPEEEAVVAVIALGKGEGEPFFNKRKEACEIYKVY